LWEFIKCILNEYAGVQSIKDAIEAADEACKGGKTRKCTEETVRSVFEIIKNGLQLFFKILKGPVHFGKVMALCAWVAAREMICAVAEFFRDIVQCVHDEDYIP